MEEFDDPRNDMKIKGIEASDFDGSEPRQLTVKAGKVAWASVLTFYRDETSGSFIWSKMENQNEEMSPHHLLLLAFVINELRDRGFDMAQNYSVSMLAEANDEDLDYSSERD